MFKTTVFMIGKKEWEEGRLGGRQRGKKGGKEKKKKGMRSHRDVQQYCMNKCSYSHLMLMTCSCEKMLL